MKSADKTALNSVSECAAFHGDQSGPGTAPPRASPAHYFELYDLSPVGYLTLGSSGRIEEINRSGAQILGWTPRWLMGKRLCKWIVAEDLAIFEAHLRAVAAGPKKVVGHLRLKNRNGRVRGVRLESIAACGSVCEVPRCLTVMLDMSEDQLCERRVRVAQAKLIQASRFNMMGEVASSLAHELNQPLGAILLDSSACLQMIREPAARMDSAKLDAALTRICESSAYAGSIIRHLRAFLRTGDRERKPVDLNSLIVDATRMIEPDARDREVAIRLELAQSLPRAHADSVQIEQVLLNLLRNSIDALESLTGKRQITISTAFAAQDHVRFSVSDTGPGVPAQIAAHLFEPLFTTKPAGMGLGLSISRSIVEAHTGRLWLDPSGHAGATFHCSLPIAARVTS